MIVRACGWWLVGVVFGWAVSWGSVGGFEGGERQEFRFVVSARPGHATI